MRHLMVALGLAASFLSGAAWSAAPELLKPAATTWAHAGWGGGGFYWAAAFHPTREGVIYMGGDVAGVYKSTDHGQNWRLINRGLPSYGVYSLAVDRQSPETLYAASTLGLCKSTDGGEHWLVLPNTGPKALRITGERNLTVRNIAVDPTDSRIVYAGSPAGRIYKSGDGGETWQEVYQMGRGAPSSQPADISAPAPGTGGTDTVAAATAPVSAVAGTVSALVVCPSQPRTVFAATSGDGVVVSRDAGQSWQSLPTPRRAKSVAVSASDPNVILGAFGADGLWKSLDRGTTWTQISGSLQKDCAFIDVAISPVDALHLYAIGEVKSTWRGHFYASEDGGKSWHETHQLQPDSPQNPTEGAPAKPVNISRVTNLAVNPLNPRELYVAGNWRPMWSGDAGRSWQERDRGADISCIMDLRFEGSRTYTCAMDEGVFMSEDNGRQWQQLWHARHSPTLSGHYWRLAITPRNGADRIISTCSPWNAGLPNRVVISEDGGKTYKESLKGLPNYNPNVNVMWGRSYARALAVDPNDPKVVYLGIDGDAAGGKSGGGIFKSLDGGYSWKQLPNQPASRRMFYGLVVDPTNSKRLFWGACGKDGGVYRSEDGGESWQKVFSGLSWVFNLKITEGGTIFCAGTTGLWRSSNHGNSWQKLAGDFGLKGHPSIIGVEVHPSKPQTIWISIGPSGESAGGGVYRTTDGGASWQEITGDLPIAKPLVLRFNPATSELWAAGVGLFKTRQ